MEIDNEKGQTTVEYILMLAVIVSVMSVVFDQLEERMLTGPNSLQARFLKGFEGSANPSGGDDNGTEFTYKYFVIRD